MATQTQVDRMRSMYCTLCGDNFTVDYGALGSDYTIPRICDERPEWRASLEETGHVEQSPADLATVYFKIPWHWRCFGRAIVEKEGGDCVLTGVGTVRPYLVLPKNTAECVMVEDLASVRHKQQRRFDNVYVMTMGEPSNSGDSVGVSHMMHERCWGLLTRIIDETLVERNLAKLLAAIHAAGGWNSRHRALIDNLYNDETAWIQSSTAERLDSADYAVRIAQYSQDWKCNKTQFALRDPLKVADIWASIEAEKERFCKEQEIDRALERPCQEHKRLSPRLRRAQSVDLPGELVMSILDYFTNSRQARRLMWVFPRWATRVPYGYWRQRFIYEFMLEGELDRVPGSGELDWRLLYYKSDRIQRESHGLQNRRRIVRILEEIKDDFEERLVDKDKDNK
ncbi:uncharacterized protein BDV17DRAFT_197821 [Aspergillus undulatus]|uniref:uncharacterized protein n=1 Tax=Aspergillus undulatus TaxID=1810928 RepID=UPI003CCCB7E5